MLRAEWAAAEGLLRQRTRIVEQQLRAGKAANDTHLLRESTAPYCLLLNEDSELQPGAAEALLAALDADPVGRRGRGPAARPRGHPQPCAWRLPGLGTALAGAFFLHRARHGSERRRSRPARSAGSSRRRCWSAAMPPRRSATSTPTSSSTRTRPTSASACTTPAGASSTSRPPGRSTTSSSRPTARAGSPRVVEFHRGRDLYMRKHHGAAAALRRPAADRLPLPAARARRARPARPRLRAGTCSTPARRCSPEPARASARRPRRLQPRVLVAALGLVDLRRSGARPRSALSCSASAAGPAGGRARRARPASRARERLAGSQQSDNRVSLARLAGSRQTRASAGRRARPRSGRAARRRPRSAAAARPPRRGPRRRRRSAPAAPTRTGREEPLGERVHQHEHDQVGGDQGEPGADDPQRRDRTRLRTMLATVATAVAGKLNSVRPVRPRITTSAR